MPISNDPHDAHYKSARIVNRGHFFKNQFLFLSCTHIVSDFSLSFEKKVPVVQENGVAVVRIMGIIGETLCQCSLKARSSVAME